MFVCSACARRAFNTVLPRLPAVKNYLTVSPKASATGSTQRQDHGSAIRGIEADRATSNPYSNRPKLQETSSKTQRAAKKELEWIHDPWHLAESVSNKLENGEFEKALLMTREASNDDSIMVSWNHLIQYTFKQEKLHAAIKLFNEMKKRGQLPNAQTYTIIFNGLADSNHPKLAVGEALKIYNAMLCSPRLRPNVKHLNAVLDVCAKAQDIESLFVTLRSATEERPPDNLTYTIILNALRYQQSNFPNPHTTLSEQEEAAAVKKSITQTISRAKLVWEEVMERWRKNEIIMDEELMCSMGRILLLGGGKETETILAMATETLGITKLKDGQPGLMPEEQRKKDRDTKDNGTGGSAPARPFALQKGTKSAQVSSSTEASNGSTGQQVVRFTANNTLSLLMRATANSRLTKLGARYWDYMTTMYGVNPDQKNYRDYLDCLFTGAASGKAARVLASMPPNITQPQAIRRGLLMCYFDNLNDKAFDNANVMLDAMTRKLRYPDPRCLTLYLDVALKARHRFSDEKNYPTQQDRDLGYGMQLFTAMDRIWEPFRLATNHITFDEGSFSAASPEEKSMRSYPARMELIGTAEAAQAVCDTMLSQRLLPVKSEEHKIIVGRRQVLGNSVMRWHRLAEHPGQAKNSRVQSAKTSIKAGRRRKVAKIVKWANQIG